MRIHHHHHGFQHSNLPCLGEPDARCPSPDRRRTRPFALQSRSRDTKHSRGHRRMRAVEHELKCTSQVAGVSSRPAAQKSPRRHKRSLVVFADGKLLKCLSVSKDLLLRCQLRISWRDVAFFDKRRKHLSARATSMATAQNKHLWKLLDDRYYRLDQ